MSILFLPHHQQIAKAFFLWSGARFTQKVEKVQISCLPAKEVVNELLTLIFLMKRHQENGFLDSAQISALGAWKCKHSSILQYFLTICKFQKWLYTTNIAWVLSRQNCIMSWIHFLPNDTRHIKTRTGFSTLFGLKFKEGPSLCNLQIH